MNLSKEFYEKFQMLIKSAYNGCANNRAYKAEPGSPLHLLLEISNQIVLTYELRDKKEITNDRLRKLMISFAESVPVEFRKKSENLHQEAIAQYFIDPSSFISNHTDQHMLYHGTDPENVIPILRNGFVLSTSKQGLAVYGSGVYVTEDRTQASSYGFLLQMKVKNNSKLKVLDMKMLKKNKELYEKLEQELKDMPYVDLNEMLKYQYNMDIIVDDHTSIQNLSVVELNEDINDMLVFLAKDFMERGIDKKSIQEFLVYNSSYQLMNRLGVELEGLCDPVKLIKSLSNRKLALVYAIAIGQDELVKNILSKKEFDEQPFSLKDLFDEHGHPEPKDYKGIFFLKAASQGCYHILELFLKQDMDVNWLNGKGGEYNALMHAAENGYLDCVKLLLEYGADINANITEESCARCSALSRASKRGHLEVVKFLLEKGADVNQKEESVVLIDLFNLATTALIHALRNKHKEVAKLLLTYGADCNIKHNIKGGHEVLHL